MKLGVINASKAHTAQTYYPKVEIFLAMQNYEASMWHSFFASLLRQLYSMSCNLFYTWPFFTCTPRPCKSGSRTDLWHQPRIQARPRVVTKTNGDFATVGSYLHDSLLMLPACNMRLITVIIHCTFSYSVQVHATLAASSLNPKFKTSWKVCN